MKHDFYTGKETGIDVTTYDMVVNGGLSVCKVCGNFEGGLSTDCPGVNAVSKADDIYAKKIDFINGQWITLPEHADVKGDA